MSKKLTADVEYVDGYLKYGHKELVLSDRDYETFKTLPDNEKEEWLKEGDLIVDDYEINDWGCIELYTLNVEDCE